MHLCNGIRLYRLPPLEWLRGALSCYFFNGPGIETSIGLFTKNNDNDSMKWPRSFLVCLSCPWMSVQRTWFLVWLSLTRWRISLNRRFSLLNDTNATQSALQLPSLYHVIETRLMEFWTNKYIFPSCNHCEYSREWLLAIVLIDLKGLFPPTKVDSRSLTFVKSNKRFFSKTTKMLQILVNINVYSIYLFIKTILSPNSLSFVILPRSLSF